MEDKRTIKEIYNCQYIKTTDEMYPLQKWYNRLIDLKISELEVSDVLRMIRQNEFLNIAIFKALEYLKENPFSGDMYEGELLYKLSDTDTNIIKEYLNEINAILSDTLIKSQNHEWLDDTEKNEFTEMIIKFRHKINNFMD